MTIRLGCKLPVLSFFPMLRIVRENARVWLDAGGDDLSAARLKRRYLGAVRWSPPNRTSSNPVGLDPRGVISCSSERRALSVLRRRVSCLRGAASSVPSVESDYPPFDHVDPQVRLTPGVASERVTDLLLGLRLDGEHDAHLIAQRAAQHDEAVVHEPIHERR